MSAQGVDVSRYFNKYPPINCDPTEGPVCLQPAGKKRRKKGAITAIDLFAGAGGFTQGAEAAGADVLFAINHSKLAVTTHAINHPHTVHCCEDVFRFDFRVAPVADVILASPSCKAHSPAGTRGLLEGKRGTAAHHDRLRATPEAVRQAAATMKYMGRGHQPFIVVENVVEFRKEWDGYRGWKIQIEDSGYTSSEVVIDALDLGVPSTRKRLFVIFTPRTVSNAPFVIDPPKKRKRPATIGKGLKRDHGRNPAWVELTDWPRDSVIKKALENKRRITERMGRKVPSYWTFTTTTATNPKLPDEPQRTITHKMGNQLYVVHSKGRRDWIRQVSVEEGRAWMGFPASYKLPNSVGKAFELLGNSVAPPVSEYIVRQLIERA